MASLDTPYVRAEQDDGRPVVLEFVYHLRWPKQNGTCALFIPDGEDIGLFTPIMGEPGLFKIVPGVLANLLSKMKKHYELSDAICAEATGCPSRCGKYRVCVRRLSATTKKTWMSFTMQGGPCTEVLLWRP